MFRSVLRALPRPTSRNTTSLLLIGALGLAGCVDPRARYITANDACSTIREPFVQIREQQIAEIEAWAARGATAGAAAGALIGAATGDSAGESLVNALIGGAIGIAAGALAGATIGYFANLEDRELQTSALRNTVFDDAGADANRADTLVRAVSDLNACRIRQVQRIAFDYESGAITADEAQARLDFQRAAVDDDNDLIETIVSGLSERTQVYVGALDRSGLDDAEGLTRGVEGYSPRVASATYTIGGGASGSGATTTVNRGANVRAGPSTSDAVLGTLAQGTRVEVIRREGSWSFVSGGGLTGYIANSLLGDRPSGGGNVTPVKLETGGRPKSNNKVEQLARSAVELDAVQEAHVASVNQSIDDTEALLL